MIHTEQHHKYEVPACCEGTEPTSHCGIWSCDVCLQALVSHSPPKTGDVKKRAESALNELKASQSASSSQLTCRICSVHRRVTRCHITTTGGGDGCVYQGLLLPLSRLPLSALLSRGASYFSRLNALATVNTLSSTFHWDEQTNRNHCAAVSRGERRTCLY